MRSLGKILFVITFLFVTYSSKAQTFNPNNFNIKLNLSELLLTKQPTREKLQSLLPKEFGIDSLQEFKYFLKDSMGIPVIVYLHIKTLKIVYIEFYENQLFQKDMYDYIIQKKSFDWIGSEHNCDYFNNKKTAIVICPGMEKGMMIHISKYDL